VAAYVYDAASRVTSITYTLGGSPVGDLTYTYDADGHRTSVGGSLASANLPAALTSASYNANNQLTQWGAASLSYDLNGNMTSDGTSSMSWNARDQLSALGGTSFAYDALGRRIQTASGNAFLYDGVNAVQELSGSTVTANLLTGLGVDEVFTRTDSAGARNFLSDALGSTMALADSSGAVQTQYSYEPFGKTTASGTSNTNTFQFASRENDGTGMYYYRARYYNPTLQRFVSEDPLGFGGGDTNLYAHVGNDPTDLIDPSGESTIYPPVDGPFAPFAPPFGPPFCMLGCGGGAGGGGGGSYPPGGKRYTSPRPPGDPCEDAKEQRKQWAERLEAFDHRAVEILAGWGVLGAVVGGAYTGGVGALLGWHVGIITGAEGMHIGELALWIAANWPLPDGCTP
jgi:RHS repeat-associated protein